MSSFTSSYGEPTPSSPLSVFLTAHLTEGRRKVKEERGKVLSSTAQCVQPGEVLGTEAGYLRGHGTYEKDNQLHATVNGVVERVNKLISVKPLKARYHAEIGDVVVGRIHEVLQRSWKVDINGRQDAMLQLSAIHLPGGAQRRRNASDELQMRSFFSENDVISAEVQQLYQEGGLALHTRSLKYGKLADGQLVTVPACLIKRVKNHFYSFEFGVEMILGTNGMIWLSALREEENSPEEQQEGKTPISGEVREKISRVRNSIESLAALLISIYPDAIRETYNTSLELNIPAKDMLKPDIIQQVTKKARFANS